VPSAIVRPPLSIVVPALNEAQGLPTLLSTLAGGVALPYEVVVADGGSTDGTPDAARAAGARTIAAARGRGRQLGAGAAEAMGEVLWFLHADARPDERLMREVADLAAGHASGTPLRAAHSARLVIDAPGAAYRLVETGANLRSRLASLPYGDQGLLVSRAHYDAVGGHPAWPLMEDVALVRALRRGGVPVRLLGGTITVSARRWQRDGVLRRTLGNWGLLARYLAGASPEELAREYRR
jgi:rSAM/selenodomain-associated transferase 2